jgi:hypothetical protein
MVVGAASTRGEMNPDADPICHSSSSATGETKRRRPLKCRIRRLVGRTAVIDGDRRRRGAEDITDMNSLFRSCATKAISGFAVANDSVGKRFYVKELRLPKIRPRGDGGYRGGGD